MDPSRREKTPSSVERPRRRIWPRLLLGLLLVLILLPLAAAALAYLAFDPNAYKGRIEAAASAALGRPVTIDGKISLTLSLTPSIRADHIRIANLPGGSAPEMIRVGAIDSEVALLPLLHHRIDITRLALEAPSILLERTADGTPNWVFRPQAAASGGSAQPAVASPAAPITLPGQHSGAPWQVVVRAITISQGIITWHDGATSDHLTIPEARLSAQSGAGTPLIAAPLRFAAKLLWQGQTVALRGQTGPVAALIAPAAGADWPVSAQLTAAGARATIAGQVSMPARMADYHFTLMAEIPALEALQPLLPPGLLPAGITLPPLHQVAIGATIADAGKGAPRLQNISLQAGNSDLGGLLPGLTLNSLSLTTAAPDQPVAIDLLAARNGVAFTLAGSTGPLTALMPHRPVTPPQPAAPVPAAPQPAALWPIALQLTAGPSSIHLAGGIADPAALRGLSLSLSAQIARLDALSPLAGVTLPAIPSLSAKAALHDGPQGLAHGLSLSGLILTAPEGDLEGAIGLGFGHPLTLSADLRSARLDLDGLFDETKPGPAAPGPAAPGPAAPQPAAPGHAAAPATPQPATGPTFIPAIPVPSGLLHAANGTVNLAFASLRLGGVDYRALVAHARLQQGVFTLDPSSVVLPGGRILVASLIDTRPAIPRVTLAFQAQSIAIAPLLQAYGLPPAARGQVQAFSRLAADGTTLRALVANASGEIGLAMVNGAVEGKVLAGLLAPALHAAGALPETMLRDAGTVPVHCLALRLNPLRGNADVAALVLDTNLLELLGRGHVDFGHQSLDLALTPRIFLGDMDVTVPMQMTGPMTAPRVGRIGKLVLSQRSGGDGGGISGFLQSVIGHGKVAGHGVSAACGPALSLARDGQPGEAPEPASGPALLNRPMNLFQQLLHGG